MTAERTTGVGESNGAVPPRPGLVLAALVLAALVCNLNLAAANIALPEIGDDFAAGQTGLNLVALGCSLGLAMSVLYLGALADRYGRKQMLLMGLALTVVASFAAAAAPSLDWLIAARIFTGVAAGMAYPTTLSLITALWSRGPARTRAIALWSSVSAMSGVLGAVAAGLVLEVFHWQAAFLLAAPIAAAGFLLVLVVVPSHIRESTERVDHVGGVLSVFGVAALVVGVGIVAAPEQRLVGGISLALAVALLACFVWRQRAAASPLYDFAIAGRRMFWVPAVAGMIVFGSLMGAMFVGQQFLQNILGYDTLEAGLAVVPAAAGLLIAAPVSARMVTTRGSRTTMLVGYGFVFVGFLTTLLWREHTPYWLIGVGFFTIGVGAGFAMTPASRALTDATPVRRVGMASATSDLQRDLGGSIMQALLGAILATGFAGAFARAIAASPSESQVSGEVQAALQASFASAMHVADRFPQYRSEIVSAATQSLVDGALWAYAVGGVAIISGAILVRVVLPSHTGEHILIEEYAAADTADDAPSSEPADR